MLFSSYVDFTSIREKMDLVCQALVETGMEDVDSLVRSHQDDLSKILIDYFSTA